MTTRSLRIVVLALGTLAIIAFASNSKADDGEANEKEEEKPIRLFAVTKKFIGILPRSWSGPILDSQSSFEKFLRWSFSGGDRFDAPPIPASAAEPAAEPADPTLSSDFFYRPISGGAPILGVESSRFRGSLVLGRDFRAGTLNSTFGEQPDLWSTDPTASEFVLDAENLDLETFYETYQLVPQAVYIRVEF